MLSRLYEGRVWHERLEPEYRLEHAVFYLELHLSELDEVSRALKVLGHNRPNLLSLNDRDFDVLAQPDRLAEHRAAGRSLLTMPRLLGYAFNPVSFLLQRDADGRVQDVLAEVHNTFGERHVYELPREEGRPDYRSSADKRFYVSPMLEPAGFYSFALSEDDSGALSIRISEAHDRASAPHFAAGMELRRRELTRANLLGALVRYPLLNLKVITAIHWHALRVWRRGAKFHPHTPIDSTRRTTTR